ncbi:trk system potassium uptake protein TrkH [Idiomarina aquatica]|uniref:Trk system potassium uptake protein n=1 Tax=Idiomarina aquatica TaxID=1327752 RepID=A0A4R6PQB5_9GAMM|nr:potassium transporter TrkG [Idiomarina aquatica]TDP40516.1 trk system potassium uptake protein TrkH [Idiomarina aquatica]
MNFNATVRLLFWPVVWIAGIQWLFAVLALFVFKDKTVIQFIYSGLIGFAFAILLYVRYHRAKLTKLFYREALAFASFTWVVVGVLGALPIWFITGVSFTDATFESISAMTTTGATILVGLDDMPRSFLLYRQFLQWMGGLGIVIFVVAILPMLNVGGMRLLRAETPGPIKNDKLAPRVSSTSRYLWAVYVVLTVSCGLAYWLAGMESFDAIAHAFTTVSTGGFSPYDGSMGHFDNHYILAVADVFMILGAISFALHHNNFTRRSLSGYIKDEETRWMLLSILILGAITTLFVLSTNTHERVSETISQSVFHVISFMTSTGYGADDLSAWPAATAGLLIFASYLGGCAGSTAGGNKFIRNILTVKILRQQMMQAIHPQAILHVRYQGKVVKNDVILAVMGFMLLVAISSLVLTVLLTMTGLDFFSAFTAVVACINVLGPGFGEVSSNFIPVSDTGTWLLSFAMILGRLEYFTVLTLLLPKFWRD